MVAGFFYVSGHGISAAPLFEAVRSLFDLPEPAKAALDARLSPLHRGYTGLGGAHNCVPEESCVVGPDRKESYLLGEPVLLTAVSPHNNNSCCSSVTAAVSSQYELLQLCRNVSTPCYMVNLQLFT
jgi:isopenicillin N synthase-like dioxygenase